MKLEEQAQHANALSEIAVTAVYFLLDGGEVVYVGKTTNLHSRLQTHISDMKAGRSAAWTSFAYIVCRPEDVGFEEAKYIAKYRPAGNRRERGGPRGGWTAYSAEKLERLRVQGRVRQQRFRERLAS